MTDAHDQKKVENEFPRFERQPIVRWLLIVASVIFVLGSLRSAEVDGARIWRGAARVVHIADEMIPPRVSRISILLKQTLVTLQIATLGTLVGVIASLGLGRYACRHTSPRWLGFILRSVVGIVRTIPELIWGLLFVASFGLGPFAGVLAVAADTFGFCGRFFTEAFDDIEDKELEGLRAFGVSTSGLFAALILPRAFPTVVHTSLYSLERAVRASIVLGLVGAGGIGVELDVAMRLFRYDEACTIMLIILALVLTIERASESIRRSVRYQVQR